jgi:hypothetical protein
MRRRELMQYGDRFTDPAAADKKRQTITWVEYRNSTSGENRAYFASGGDSSLSRLNGSSLAFASPYRP